MRRFNIIDLNTQLAPLMGESAPRAILSPEIALRRAVMAGLTCEAQNCEGGVTVPDRVAALVPQVDAAVVAALAIEARERTDRGSMPLLLVREMARYASHRALVATTLALVIQHPDELVEFVILYWKDGKQPLSAQVKKGLAAAFVKFDGYQLAKYDRATSVRLRDVLFLCHPRPLDVAQEVLWKQLAEGSLSASLPERRPKSKEPVHGQAL